jgi:hypothetical protein
MMREGGQGLPQGYTESVILKLKWETLCCQVHSHGFGRLTVSLAGHRVPGFSVVLLTICVFLQSKRVGKENKGGERKGGRKGGEWGGRGGGGEIKREHAVLFFCLILFLRNESM